MLKIGNTIQQVRDFLGGRLVNGLGLTSDSNPMIVMFAAGANFQSFVAAGVFTRVGNFIFDGTDNVGDPSSILVNGFKDPLATTAEFRVIDITNGGLVIATGIGVISQDEFNIVDLGVLANLPIGRAVFQIEARRTGGAGAAFINSLSVNF